MADGNNDGMSGVKIEHIANELITLIGMQAPNVRPSSRESKDRTQVPTISMRNNSGAQLRNENVYDAEMVDNSNLSYGGKYTLGIGNKWHIRCGSGGIYTETTGPTVYDGETITINGKKTFVVQTKLFQVMCEERGMISGKRLDFNFEQIQFMGNVTFANNVMFNGGIYTNGEMVANHLTTQRQQNVTEMVDEIVGFLNPAMSFHVFQGYSAAAAKYTPKSLLGVVFEGLDVTDNDDNMEWIEAEMCINTDFITQIIPGLDKVGLDIVKMLLALPIKLKFPKGISLISDASDVEFPEVYPAMKAKARAIGEAIEDDDLFGPGHSHCYSGPACTLLDSSQDVMRAGAQIAHSPHTGASQTIIGGYGSWGEVPEGEAKKVTNSVKRSWWARLKKSFGIGD